MGEDSGVELNSLMDKTNTEKSGIRPGVIIAVIAVVGLLVAGRMLGWFGRTVKTADQNATEPVSALVDRTSPETAPVRGAVRNPPAESGTATIPGVAVKPGSIASVPGAGPGGVAPVPGSATAPDAAIADWSEKLDDILGSEADESKKADQLLAMWKQLPEDGQVETMQHISNLLADDKFPVLVQTLTNATTSEAVLDIILSDALNRPNGMKLPALLEVARIPGHPKAEEARDILEVFVDADHGADWSKWEKAVNDWLKENPDEPDAGK